MCLILNNQANPPDEKLPFLKTCEIAKRDEKLLTISSTMSGKAVILAEFEQMALLALIRLGDDAYRMKSRNRDCKFAGAVASGNLELTSHPPHFTATASVSWCSRINLRR